VVSIARAGPPFTTTLGLLGNERPMEISLIAAMARNRVIGRQGNIPWCIPGEQKIFIR
jgi:hypothetical protein